MDIYPCVFCAHECKDFERGSWFKRSVIFIQVQCPNCKACGPNWVFAIGKHTLTEFDAVIAWNVRIGNNHGTDKPRNHTT